MGSTAASRLIVGVLLVACLLVVGLIAHPATQFPSVEENSSILEKKFATILENAASSGRPVPPVIVSESDANRYLREEGGERIPSGITDATVAFAEGGLISARATVDLGVVSATRSKDTLDPLHYFTGLLPVTVAGFFRTNDGIGQIEIDRVTIAGLPVPRSVLQEIVRQYSKSSTYPRGVELTDPFELPYRIREVRVRLAEVVVEQ